MINEIIKRDGSVAQFDVDNLNKWANWASEECGVDWSSVVFDAVRGLTERCSTVDLHNALINACLAKRTEGHTKMAARLLVGQLYKEAYGSFSIPSLKDFYEEAVENGWWVDMGYTDYELEELDSVIDHTKDFTYTYATLKQMYDKYLINFSQGIVETPQMLFMGIAMNQMRNENSRLEAVISAYNALSGLKLNLPTPCLNGSRTQLESSPSCAVMSGGDTVDSIQAAIDIAYKLTAQRSGIGIELTTRAPKDPVKGGMVTHAGKHNYYKHIASAVAANSQVTRGGSATVTYTVLDPEVDALLTMKQQRTPENYRIDTLDYSIAVNTLFLKKAAKKEQWMCVSPYYAPKLWELFYDANEEAFEQEYERVLASDVKKRLVNARDILKQLVEARRDTGRNYITFIDNVNKHTPFKEPIRLSNLCQEVLLPTKPFSSPRELYKEDSDGTIALCFLGSIVVDDYTDEEYEELAYTLCKLVDNTIDDTVYPYESMEKSAKSYRSIGIGMTNVAHWMAKNGYKYDTKEGRNALHRLAERHSYFLHKASVRLAREKGHCEWMDKTKYQEGWLPVDSYNKEVDKYHSQASVYDWESLREDVAKYGVRFAVLESFMPVESSSLVTGSTNGVYPVRDLEIYKNSRKGSVYFRAPEMDKLNYQLAWDIDMEDMVKVYAIIQKWAGQGISADFYHDYNKGAVSDAAMMKAIFLAAKLGMKTWYYHNYRMLDKTSDKVTEVEETACESCSL